MSVGTQLNKVEEDVETANVQKQELENVIKQLNIEITQSKETIKEKESQNLKLSELSSKQQEEINNSRSALENYKKNDKDKVIEELENRLSKLRGVVDAMEREHQKEKEQKDLEKLQLQEQIFKITKTKESLEKKKEYFYTHWIVRLNL